MAQPSKILDELQDKIIENFFDEGDSLVAFQSCSLVSKYWLHLSRTKFFSREKVYLIPQGGPFGLTVSNQVGGLQKFLIESGTRCPLWPYIRRIEIHDRSASQFLLFDIPGRDVHSAVNLALASLRYAQNLSSLYLWGFNIPRIQDKLMARIQSNSSLSTLHISHSQLAPGPFLRFLNSSGERNLEIKLSGVSTDPLLNDFPLLSSGDLPLNPNLKLVINTYNKWGDDEGSAMLFKLILRHRWNVTALHLTRCVIYGEASSSLIPSVVRHIGSLEELSIPIVHLLDEDVSPRLPPISLSTNTSLRKLRLGEIFGSSVSETDQERRRIVESLVSTIQSKGQFREIHVEVSPNWLKDEAKEKVEWNSLENILLDKERFPGSGPLLILGQDWSYKQAVPLDLMKNVSFPQLATAGNLKSCLIDEEVSYY